MSELPTLDELTKDKEFQSYNDLDKTYVLDEWRKQALTEAKQAGALDEDTEYSINEHVKGYQPSTPIIDPILHGFREMPETMARSAAAIAEVTEGAGTEQIPRIEARIKKIQGNKPIYKLRARQRLQIDRLQSELKGLKIDLKQSQEWKGAREYLEEDAQTTEAQGLAIASEDSLATKVAGAGPQALADFGVAAGLSMATGGTAAPLIYGALRSAGGTAESLLANEAGKDMTYGQIWSRSVITGTASGGLEVLPLGYLTNVNRLAKASGIQKAIPKSRVFTGIQNTLNNRAGAVLKGGVAEGGQEITQEFVEKLGSELGYDQVTLDASLDILSEYAKGDEWKVAGILGTLMGGPTKATIGYEASPNLEIPEGESMGEVMAQFTKDVQAKIGANIDQHVTGPLKAFVGEPLGDIYKAELDTQRKFEDETGKDLTGEHDALAPQMAEINAKLQDSTSIDDQAKKATDEILDTIAASARIAKDKIVEGSKIDLLGNTFHVKRDIAKGKKFTSEYLTLVGELVPDAKNLLTDEVATNEKIEEQTEQVQKTAPTDSLEPAAAKTLEPAQAEVTKDGSKIIAETPRKEGEIQATENVGEVPKQATETSAEVGLSKEQAVEYLGKQNIAKDDMINDISRQNIATDLADYDVITKELVDILVHNDSERLKAIGDLDYEPNIKDNPFKKIRIEVKPEAKNEAQLEAEANRDIGVAVYNMNTLADRGEGKAHVFAEKNLAKAGAEINKGAIEARIVKIQSDIDNFVGKKKINGDYYKNDATRLSILKDEMAGAKKLIEIKDGLTETSAEVIGNAPIIKDVIIKEGDFEFKVNQNKEGNARVAIIKNGEIMLDSKLHGIFDSPEKAIESAKKGLRAKKVLAGTMNAGGRTIKKIKPKTGGVTLSVSSLGSDGESYTVSVEGGPRFKIAKVQETGKWHEFDSKFNIIEESDSKAEAIQKIQKKVDKSIAKHSLSWPRVRGIKEGLFKGHGFISNGRWMVKEDSIKLPPSAQKDLLNTTRVAPTENAMNSVFEHPDVLDALPAEYEVVYQDGTKYAKLTNTDGHEVFLNVDFAEYFKQKIGLTFKLHNDTTRPVYGYDKNGEHVFTLMPLRIDVNKKKAEQLQKDRKQVSQSKSEQFTQSGMPENIDPSLDFSGATENFGNTVEADGNDINYYPRMGRMSDMDAYSEADMNLIDGTALINSFDNKQFIKIFDKYGALGSYRNAKGTKNVMNLRSELAVGPRLAAMSKHEFEQAYRKFKDRMYKAEKSRLINEEDMDEGQAHLLAKQYSSSFTKTDYLSILSEEILQDPKIRERGVLPEHEGRQGAITSRFFGDEVVFLQRNHNYAGSVMLHEIGHWIDDSDVIRWLGVNKRNHKIIEKVTANIDRDIREMQETLAFADGNKDAIARIQSRVADLNRLKEDRQQALSQVLKNFTQDASNKSQVDTLKKSMKADMKVQAHAIQEQVNKIEEKGYDTNTLKEYVEAQVGPSNKLYAVKRIIYARELAEWSKQDENIKYTKDKKEHDRLVSNEKGRKARYIKKEGSDEGYVPTYTDSAPALPLTPKPKKPATPPINDIEIAERMKAFDKNKNFDANILREEMIQASKYWRGNWVNPDVYRNRPNELIADMFSLMFNNPTKFNELMPMTKAYLEFYNQDRPEMTEKYKRLIIESTESESVKRTYEEVKADMEDLAQNGTEVVEPDSWAKKFANIFSFTQNQRARVGYEKRKAINRIKAEAKKKGETIDPKKLEMIEADYDTFAYANQAQIYSSNGARNYEKIANMIMDDAISSGLSQADIEAAMFLYRTIGERADFFNPMGVRGETAQIVLKELKKNLTDSQLVALDKFRKDFINLRKTVTDRVRRSGMATDAFVEFIENNEDYVRFEVQQEGRDLLFESFGMPSVMQRKVGTLKKLTKAPVEATVMRDMFIMTQADKVISEKALIKSLTSIEEISGLSETALIQPITQGDRTSDDFMRLTIPVKGQPVHYAIHKDFKYLLESSIAEPVQKLLRNVLHPVREAWITYNPYFPAKNLIRDFLNTWMLEGNLKVILNSYRNNVARAYNASFKGKFDERTQDLMKRSLLQMDTESRYNPETDQLIVKGRYKKRVKKKGLLAKKWDSNLNILKPVFDSIAHANNFSELISKMAAADRIEGSEDGKNMTASERDFWIRNTGSPAFLDVGSNANYLNALFIFSSATLAGHKQQYLYLKKDPKGVLLRRMIHTAISQGIPAILATILAKSLGLDDEEKKKMLANITTEEYVYSNVIPVWYDRKTGKTYYFRVAKDHHQMIVDSAYLATRAEHRRAAFVSTIKSAIPAADEGALNPIFSAMWDVGKTAGGGTPTNRFGQDAFDREARGADAAWELAKHVVTSKSGGLGTIAKDIGGLGNVADETAITLGAPIGLKKSDSGVLQKGIQHRQDLSSERAGFIEDELDDIKSGLTKFQVRSISNRMFFKFIRSEDVKEKDVLDKKYLRNKGSFTKAFKDRYRKRYGAIK